MGRRFVVTALDSQDFLTLALALDMLSKHVEGELTKASQQNSASVKQLALLNMRQHVKNVRAKLQAMENAQ
jgi:hypothetical protein